MCGRSQEENLVTSGAASYEKLLQLTQSGWETVTDTGKNGMSLCALSRNAGEHSVAGSSRMKHGSHLCNPSNSVLDTRPE